MTAHVGKIAESAKGVWAAFKVRHLKFHKLADGHISVRAETPRGTRLAYKQQVMKMGFDFKGTRYNPETVVRITGKGLLKGAVSNTGLCPCRPGRARWWRCLPAEALPP